jgi:hypothetical protein
MRGKDERFGVTSAFAVGSTFGVSATAGAVGGGDSSPYKKASSSSMSILV